jgi:putative transcriptional regulator
MDSFPNQYTLCVYIRLSYNSIMIKIKLNEFLNEKKLTMYWLSKQTGIRYATIFSLTKDKAKPFRLSLDVLDRICEALDCQPGDLLVREVGSKRKAKTKSKSK